MVPDPRFPFLGVHFTPTIYGDVILGPNAVMAFSREGYNKLDFSAKDFIDSIKYRGTQKLIFKYACYGFGELTRSFYIPAQIKLLQQYIPEITSNDVEIGRTGVRAQALDIDGNLVDEFVYDSGKGPLSSRIIHVRNAPSPAATSSLAIAEMILEKCEEQFGI
uniref:FAD dependent oxidoreductase domain-containing protein n=1 Tax=Meloidogyne incognita TaxID=6306 RepID=A0A914MHC5_MELIC